MFQALACDHASSMGSSRFAQASIDAQRRNSRECATLVGRFQEFVLGGQVLTRGGSSRRVRVGGGLLDANVVTTDCLKTVTVLDRWRGRLRCTWSRMQCK